MPPHSAPHWPRSLTVLVMAAVASCVLAAPAAAKKHENAPSPLGGIYQAPSPVNKPMVIIDTSRREPDANPGSNATTLPDEEPLPPALPIKGVNALRVHPLFE